MATEQADFLNRTIINFMSIVIILTYCALHCAMTLAMSHRSLTDLYRFRQSFLDHPHFLSSGTQGVTTLAHFSGLHAATVARPIPY